MAIRILHVIPALGRGGAERQLVTVVCNTRPGEFEHVVCCLRGTDSFADDIRAAGHSVICLSLSGEHAWVSAAKRLIPLLCRRRPDLVQTWLYDASISARLAQLFASSVPSVTALQDLIYEPESVRAMNWSPWKIAIRRWIDRVSMTWSRPMFVAPSHAWEEAAKKHLGIEPSRIRTIYNSVDPEAFCSGPGDAAELRQSHGIPKDAVVFLNVGRLDPQKGQAYLLRAFHCILPQAPTAYLVILGDGLLRSALRQLASELGIADRVRFPGIRTDVGAFFEMADVFVFPSVFEGLGLALVEAMAKGLPCIASRLPALTEVIADSSTGMLVRAGTVEELAGAMLGLYGDGARRAVLGRHAQADALRRFHIDATIPEWERLYREMVATRNGGSSSAP